MTAPSITYIPSQETEASFWAAEGEKSASQPRVPSGFPLQLTSSLAWTPEDVQAKFSEWTLSLTEKDIIAIEDALAVFEAVSDNPSDISNETFPLPEGLTERLRQVSRQCYSGLGFKIVHGLNPLKYSQLQNVVIFAGLAYYVAPKRGFVNRDRMKVLAHSVNAAEELRNGGGSAPAFSDKQVAFHSDASEILALYALDLAPHGGNLMLSSAWQVYNDLALYQPETLDTLCDDWVLDTFMDHEKHPPLTTPLFHRKDDGGVHVRFSRYPMTGFSDRQRSLELPAPTTAQIAAMDAVQFRAARNAVTLPYERGDIVFINDTALLHGREPFDEGGQRLKRHLLKMYLHDPEQDSPVPATAQQHWNELYGSNSWGGLRKETWDIYYRSGLPRGGFSNG